MNCNHCDQPLKSESYRVEDDDGERYFCSKDCIRNQQLCDVLADVANSLD